MFISKKLPAVLFAGSLALTCAACGDDEETPPPTTTAPKKEPKKKEEPVEEPKEESADVAYTYNAINRRDPFKTYFDELQIIETDTKNLTELQRIELDKLSLVGVVSGTATPMAMLEDASGRGHTVKIGTLVGKRFGQVKQIRPGEIVVQEEFRDFTGKRIPVYKTLKLRRLEDGKKRKK